jgi:pimeloyl-ACP methyl ester carboxylesterase
VPVVLVHGVPETTVVWESLRSKLRRRDVVALSLPGFGCARPEGFGASKEEYVDWLAAELEALRDQGPIDLVGHDWGGGFTVRLVSTRPDLVRSWITDAAGIRDSSFEWHEYAKIWQTPGAGEEYYDRELGRSVDERAGVYQHFGASHDEAIALAAALDQSMADCILALYRSAVDVAQEWAPDFTSVAVPGLVVVPSEDPFLSADSAKAAAAAAGASVAELSGLSHWWILQDPAAAAEVLEKFWASC